MFCKLWPMIVSILPNRCKRYSMHLLKPLDHDLKHSIEMLYIELSFHSRIWKILSFWHSWYISQILRLRIFPKKCNHDDCAKETLRVTEEKYNWTYVRTDTIENTHRILDRAFIQKCSSFLTVGRRARSSNFACSSATKTLLARESFPLSFTMHPISKVLHARPGSGDTVSPLPPTATEPFCSLAYLISEVHQLGIYFRIREYQAGRKKSSAWNSSLRDRSFDRVDSRRFNPTTVL